MFTRSQARFVFPKSPALWTSEELRIMRQLADAGTPIARIAARLRRSPSAIRNKAGLHGISLKRSQGLANTMESSDAADIPR